jgi:hypothetical protein
MRSRHLGSIAGQQLRRRSDRTLKGPDPKRDLIDPDVARIDIIKIDSRGRRGLATAGSQRLKEDLLPLELEVVADGIYF